MADKTDDAQGSFRLLAPAKVNLFLHVTGKRDDGYHMLESLVVFADIGDDITASPAHDIELQIDGPQSKGLVSDQAENLIVSAARSLQPSGAATPGVHFHLTKNLPVASGIGGGSSDAASAVRLLEKIWPLDLPATKREDVLLSLGADVPVCYLAEPAMMSGIGETLVPLNGIPKMAMVLANPGVGVPTGGVFKRLSGFSDPGIGADVPQGDFSDFIRYLSVCRNSLEQPALEIEPVIGDVLREMARLPDCALARMSGSGATCFGLFEDIDKAQSAAAALRSSHPDWWVDSGQVLQKRPVLRQVNP